MGRESDTGIGGAVDSTTNSGSRNASRFAPRTETNGSARPSNPLSHSKNPADSQKPSIIAQANAASTASPALTYLASLENEGEEGDVEGTATKFSRNSTLEGDGGNGISRLPSYGIGGVPLPQFNIDVDQSKPVEPGPFGNVPNNGDLPVGQGGPPNKRKICILSLDGGGMRGLIAARILSRLEAMLQEKLGSPKVKLCDYFDLLAGSSTGAVLATMLVTPDEHGEPIFTAEGCCKFYKENGRYIFQPRWYDPFNGSVRQLYRPKYSAQRFETLLKKYTNIQGRELTLLDTLKPIVVSSFDISEATPFFFVRQAAQKDPSRNFRLWEVCRAIAAAPTYFPPAYVQSVDGKTSGTLIDGGAIQNNPALVATTHAMSNNEEFPDVNGLEDILILSIGAGQLDQKHELKKASKWGMTKWVRPIMNIMMDGTADTVDYQLAAAYAGSNCSENYLRIQLSGLPNKTAIMDCTTPENIHDLVQISDNLLKNQAVMRNSYGEKMTLEETHEERLSWFADQMIIQKKLREEKPSDPQPGSQHTLPPYIKEGLGPTSRLVSPLFSRLFEQRKHTDLPGLADKASLLKVSANLSMAGRMSLFDVHCHLQDIRILQKAPELIKAATDVGVRWIAVNGTSEEDWQHVKQMGQDYSSIIIPCFGLHPWWINNRSQNWLSNLKAMLESEPSAAVGEVGLCQTPRGKQVDESLQLEILKQQLHLAREIHRPAAVHCVGAYGPLQKLLEEMGIFPSGIILHSYTGNSQQVKNFAKHGAYFSFSGHNTKLKREKARQVWRAVPKDRLLLETDCPDGLPQLDADSLVWVSGDPNAPFGSKCCQHDDDEDDDDGRRAEKIKEGDNNLTATRKPGKGVLNQPANIRTLLSHVASLLDVTEGELAERTFENAKRLFSYQGASVLD